VEIDSRRQKTKMHQGGGRQLVGFATK
jgi:hypothetical protein